MIGPQQRNTEQAAAKAEQRRAAERLEEVWFSKLGSMGGNEKT